ncbi:MAG: hypothetical protein WCL32_07810 [Planctomycetota bacterium]
MFLISGGAAEVEKHRVKICIDYLLAQSKSEIAQKHRGNSPQKTFPPVLFDRYWNRIETELYGLNGVFRADQSFADSGRKKENEKKCY